MVAPLNSHHSFEHAAFVLLSARLPHMAPGWFAAACSDERHVMACPQLHPTGWTR